MQYFKHQTNMRFDNRVRRLIRKFGIQGYGLYNLILESITESMTTENPIPVLKETSEDIAYEFGIQQPAVEEMMIYMCENNLIEIVDQVIFCRNIYKFLEASATRSDAIRKMIAAYKEQDRPEDFVYVISVQDENDRIYKIGKSVNPSLRLLEIEKEKKTKGKLELTVKSPNGYALENELHKKFSEQNIKGEWFRLSEDDLLVLEVEYKFTRSFLYGTKVIEPEPEPEPEPELSKITVRKKPVVFDSESEPYRLAVLLRKEHLEIDPQYLPPGAPTEKILQGWSKEIDKLLRLKKRDAKEVARVIHWIKHDYHPDGDPVGSSWKGWATVIMSGDKLYKKYDTIFPKTKNNGSISDVENSKIQPGTAGFELLSQAANRGAPVERNS